MYDKITFLKRSELFEDLNPYAIFIIACLSQIKTFKFGEIIFEQDQIPCDCYVVVEGDLKVARQSIKIQNKEIIPPVWT